ncbi:MAG: molecular chaperone [Desulfopila sp.]
MTEPLLHDGLQAVSLMFCHPDAKWSSTPLGDRLPAAARTVIVTMRAERAVVLEGEYIRLFVNSMPEVPCAPYGSVYLEGTVMGESTLKVAQVYRQYGLVTSELADHIAVEAEFLAWLHGRIDGSHLAAENFTFLLDHLRSWTSGFFAAVEHHDRLGCYRQAARAARTILAGID